MKRKSIVLCVVMCVALFSPIFIAESDYPAKCFELKVHVLGSENYTVHDELVMIRYHGENESSPVLFQTRTKDNGTASFCMEKGTYWVDVRNIWVLLTINDNIDFTFPYKLFNDSKHYTKID